MSWQAYVDTGLLGTGHIDKAAIYDSAGTSLWASSPGFTMSSEEMKVITASFKPPAKPDDVKEVQAHGFFVGGEKFIALRSDESRLYGKKGKEGIVVVKTKQALLIAHYPDSVLPGTATNTVEMMGEYLSKLGY